MNYIHCKHIRRWILAILLLLCCSTQSHAAFGLNLDSIAAMGKFPRFCVNTYRWGDQFFNGYDTLYVEPTGYKFTGKIKTESWTDYYHPRFENHSSMTMLSDPSTSLGFYLTYLAVSVGYDINISKIFGNDSGARKRWQFGFRCMLFSADFYLIKNDVGTSIKKIRFPNDGPSYSLNIPFDGVNTSEWGLSAYYFFNHKKYSEAAAFSQSRVQKRSGGSFFTGFAFSKQNVNFDFSKLPTDFHPVIPQELPDMQYTINCHNYAFIGGYGYNWVFHEGWNLGVTVAPMIGWSDGYVKQHDVRGTTFSMFMRGKLGIVWNHNQWFISGTSSMMANLVGSRDRNLLSSYFQLELSAGFRFNLW